MGIWWAPCILDTRLMSLNISRYGGNEFWVQWLLKDLNWGFGTPYSRIGLMDAILFINLCKLERLIMSCGFMGVMCDGNWRCVCISHYLHFSIFLFSTSPKALRENSLSDFCRPGNNISSWTRQVQSLHKIYLRKSCRKNQELIQCS